MTPGKFEVRRKAASAKQRIASMLRTSAHTDEPLAVSTTELTSQLPADSVTGYLHGFGLTRAEMKRAEATEHWRRWDRPR